MTTDEAVAAARRAGRIRLYLLRHGEPADTAMFYGHHDIALSERGRRQAVAQGQALAQERIDVVHTSDLTRADFGAQQVVAQARQRSGVDIALHRSPQLREMHLGDLEQVPYGEARTRFPELASMSYLDMLDFRMPGGGESVRDVAQRVLPYVESVVRDCDGDDTGIVVYAHNTVVRILLSYAAGLGASGYGRFAAGYGAISRVDLRSASHGPTDAPTTKPEVEPEEQSGSIWRNATIAFSNRRPRP